jgi:hypothetical protein
MELRTILTRREGVEVALAERPADRPDPEFPAAGVDVRHRQGYRWSSSAAKKALAARDRVDPAELGVLLLASAASQRRTVDGEGAGATPPAERTPC